MDMLEQAALGSDAHDSWKLEWGHGESRTLSATIGPLVALVSAAITTPPSNRHPTMVVPVLVALGSGTPWAWRAALRLWLEKSKPPIVVLCMWKCLSGLWRRRIACEKVLSSCEGGRCRESGRGDGVASASVPGWGALELN